MCSNSCTNERISSENSIYNIKDCFVSCTGYSLGHAQYYPKIIFVSEVQSLRPFLEIVAIISFYRLLYCTNN